MTTKKGLPCNAVYSFIEDRQKSWWLLTPDGRVGGMHPGATFAYRRLDGPLP